MLLGRLVGMCMLGLTKRLTHLEQPGQPCTNKYRNHDYLLIMMTSSNAILRIMALCEGNPPVTGGFPSQKPITRGFDVFFDLCLNKQLKKSRRRWFETPSRSLWRHCNESPRHLFQVSSHVIHILISQLRSYSLQIHNRMITTSIRKTTSQCHSGEIIIWHWVNLMGPSKAIYVVTELEHHWFR